MAWGLYIIADDSQPTIIVPQPTIELTDAEYRITEIQKEYEQAELNEDNNPIEQPMEQIKLPIIDDVPRETDFMQSTATVNRVTLHHTVVFDNDAYKVAVAISRNHEARWVNWYNSLRYNTIFSKDKFFNGIANPSWTDYGYMMYHVLIGYDWTIIRNRNFDSSARPTKSKAGNMHSIHIALVGNFMTHHPSSKQYEALNKLLVEIKKDYPNVVTVNGHGNVTPTACPWKNLDYAHINDEIFVKQKQVTISDPNYLWVFNITRYYSCAKDQTKYLSWEKNTWQDNYESCNKRQFNWDLDNIQPKHWARFTNKDAWIAVACPKEIKAWTKLRIEWYKHTVICRDVWSAIKNKRLDLYVGIWDRAIDNYNTFPSWNRKIRIVK